MSTNKSQNLSLHLWEPEDNFLRTEFNENFAALDTAVKSDRTAIATAQQTANSALSKASAAYAPNQKPYVSGAYMGTGQPLAIELGFRPSFLIIYGARETTPASVDTCAGYAIFTAGNILRSAVELTDTGFTISIYADLKYPRLSESGREYDYIAFR